MRSIPGISPVIAAGFMAHLDIAPWRCHNVALKGTKNLPCTAEKGACTDNCGHEPINYAGQWHTFAEIESSHSVGKKTRRPWNTALKTLCFKLGESFVKVQNHKDDFYGQTVGRKSEEWERNFNGENAKAAELALKKNIGKNTRMPTSGILEQCPVIGHVQSGNPIRKDRSLEEQRTTQESNC